MKSGWLFASAAAAALFTGATATHAQDAAQPPAPPAASGAQSGDVANQTPADASADELVVTGVRASLRSAQSLKRNATTVVDSIVAQDIGKLPDVNVTEALQRVTGIQIGRDYGEGSTVTIRGLAQVVTTLNGREAFTAGSGRIFNFEDIPAELVSGIDVYKTSQANLIEGGIGGSIDVRTHKPFDFKGLQLSGSARVRYGDLISKASPLASALFSDRWDTSVGEVGLLVAGTYQDRRFRSDGNTTGAPSGRSDLTGPGITPGTLVASPNGTYDPLLLGDRKRTGLTTSVQWRPTSELEFYAEYDFNRFHDNENQHGISITTNYSAAAPLLRVPVPGSATVFDGTNIISSQSFSNVPVSTFGVNRQFTDKEQTFAGGAKWNHGRFSLATDVSYIKATNDLRYAELDLTTTAPLVHQDLTTDIPSFTVEGVDLTRLSSYNVGNLTLSENHYKGDELAVTGDGKFEIGGLLPSIQFGGRYADRKAHFYPVRLLSPPTVATAASNFPQYFEPTPTPDFFAKGDVDFNFSSNYLTSISEILKDPAAFEQLRKDLGVPPVPAVNPFSIFDIGEKTWAGYAMANYDLPLPLRVDGNIGFRVVQTEETLSGFAQVNTNGVISYNPLNIDNKYTDFLPSFNARVHLTDTVQARFAASKTITRPDFNQLSPSINFVPGQNLASGGNPNLQPLESKNLDATLEWYFSPVGSLAVAGFYRKVNGFISTQATPGYEYNGVVYTLTQPVNGADGTIKGVEVAYQQFFDFLPGLLSGLGAQANYTYVDSESPSPVAGISAVPLPLLSKNSYNLVGIYEKGPLSARVAYNHRSKFYSGLATLAGGLGAATVYRNGYGWLDASASYKVSENISLTVEGSNLLRTKTQTYYTTPQSPNAWQIDDRQITAGVRFQW